MKHESRGLRGRLPKEEGPRMVKPPPHCPTVSGGAGPTVGSPSWPLSAALPLTAPWPSDTWTEPGSRAGRGAGCRGMESWCVGVCLPHAGGVQCGSLCLPVRHYQAGGRLRVSGGRRISHQRSGSSLPGAWGFWGSLERQVKPQRWPGVEMVTALAGAPVLRGAWGLVCTGGGPGCPGDRHGKW